MMCLVLFVSLAFLLRHVISLNNFIPVGENVSKSELQKTSGHFYRRTNTNDNLNVLCLKLVGITFSI